MNYFKSHYSQSRFYLSIAIFLGIVCITQPVIIINLMREASEEKVIVMDAGDNFHLVKSQPFSKTQNLQIECAKFATKSLLDRSYKGVDDQHGLEQVFLIKNCGEQIKNLYKDEQKEFDKKQINQDCEIGKIHVIKQKKSYYLASVGGQLIRTCNYMNHSFIDVKLFRLDLLMYKNPDISNNGKLPLCVVKITNYEIRDRAK